jgi:protein SCO1
MRPLKPSRGSASGVVVSNSSAGKPSRCICKINPTPPNTNNPANPSRTPRNANRGSNQADNNAESIAPKLKEKFSNASAEPRCAVNLRPARIFTDVIICPSPYPPTNNPTQPKAIPGANANPPNPNAPAANPRNKLHRNRRDTVTPPRNAPQNFVIINSPLCESTIAHCRASSGRIGPSSAVPNPASISPKCISPKEGAAVLLRSTNPTPPAANLHQPLSWTQESAVPRKPLFLLAVLALVIGCRQNPSAPANSTAQQKTFTIRGKVVATNGTHVTLDGEDVPGFMEAMTMDYKLKDPSVASELHPGDRITAKVLADKDGDNYINIQLDNIVVISQARPDYKPPVAYHVPTPGDSVPDFHLINQSDRTIHLEQFKGKLVLMTFIYTRCQLADFCPRMSRNFADIDHALSADPTLYNQTHLLSISFDPAYDTPKVLRSYGGAYTGNYTNEKFLHWDFAAPTEKDLPAVTQYFNVGVTPGDSKSLTHSLSTILIGKDGKIIAWYPTNDWKPDDVVATIRKNIS